MSMHGLRRNPSGRTIVDDWAAEERAAARRLRSARSRWKPVGIGLGAIVVLALSGLGVTMQLKGWTHPAFVADAPEPVQAAISAAAPEPLPVRAAELEQKSAPLAAPPPAAAVAAERFGPESAPESTGTAGLARDPARPRADSMPASVPPVALSPSLPVEPPAPVVAKPAPPVVQIAPEEVEALRRRAADLLSRGDVAGARLLLARAASSGNANAKFALAETYDPEVLAAMKARGIRPDPQKARELYAEALSGGVAEARARIDTLAAR